MKCFYVQIYVYCVYIGKYYNAQLITIILQTLKSISCAAKANEIYVVINIAEKVPCESAECRNDKVLYYNTNVVFDRTGKVIAKCVHVYKLFNRILSIFDCICRSKFYDLKFQMKIIVFYLCLLSPTNTYIDK